MTEYAEKLLARHVDRPAKFWRFPMGNRFITLELINRNSFGYCLLRWPDGMVKQMKWSELERVGRPGIL
jgi:hypothetical protein